MWVMFLARGVRINFSLHKLICITTYLEAKHLLKRKWDSTVTVWTFWLNPQAESFLCSTYHLYVSRIFAQGCCAREALKKSKARWDNRAGNSLYKKRAWLVSTMQKDQGRMLVVSLGQCWSWNNFCHRHTCGTYVSWGIVGVCVI